MTENTRYYWKSLSQWEIPPADARIKHKKVKTGISEQICSYVLVKETNQGAKCLVEYVKSNDITKGIFDEIFP